ncbi:hypothetical protein HJD18_15575 [Thermoleophilia bacterium SCSIO 60948]|nr:hypothetical protein HJD18_15575 [Thermoleophilia bacterium SCSIO 60948]
MAGKNVDATALRAMALGVRPPKQGAGPCVLPGHAVHPHASWLIYLAHWELWCPWADRSFSLAAVRAALAYDSAAAPHERASDHSAFERLWLPGGVEISRWAEFLDWEIGLLEPSDGAFLHVPGDLSLTARRVAESIELLLRLRSTERWRDRDQFTFARRFCRAVTGLAEDRARAGVDELRTIGVIVAVDRQGKAIVYRPGPRTDGRQILSIEDGRA